MVMKYLDPKADLTFKKIFGNHPKRLISLLNALLPLSEEEQIHEIEYLPTELVPEINSYRYAVANILCTDAMSNKFCVVIRIEWSNVFKQRVLFNASKLYVSQAKKGERYCALQPVYSLNLVNDIFERDTPEFIHNYRIVHDKDSNKVIKGLHLLWAPPCQSWKELWKVSNSILIFCSLNLMPSRLMNLDSDPSAANSLGVPMERWFSSISQRRSDS